MILGLIRPDVGTAAIARKPYPKLASPARTAGALLDRVGLAHAARRDAATVTTAGGRARPPNVPLIIRAPCARRKR
jgi:hypothetical protein